jgi:hypothetical protein
VRLRAQVDAGRSPGAYLIPTAVIPGRDRKEEIVFSCHLDHPSPGANDNASGCAGILEIARTLQRLVRDKRLPQPKRTIRFIWPCEIECTISLLNARPEFATRTLATVHLDMIGGNTEITKGALRVEGSPPSLPSFVSDVGFTIARWVDAQATRYANEGAAPFALLDPAGTKNPVNAKIGGFSEGSDHQVWAEGSWRVPVIYVADWPDRYIHTNKDVPGNLDATKMKRAMFIAAASAWVLANLDEADARAISTAHEAEKSERSADALRGASGLAPEDAARLSAIRSQWEGAVEESTQRFGLRLMPPPIVLVSPAPPGAEQGPVYRRNPKLKGPMDGFGYSWLDDHLKQKGLERPALLAREATFDGIGFGYETLNLVDGERSVRAIRDQLAVTVGPAPIEEVEQYLATLERLGAVERVR